MVLLIIVIIAALGYVGLTRFYKPKPAVTGETLDLSAEALDRRLLATEQTLTAIQSERRNLQQRLDESSNRTSLLRDEMLGISERAALIEDSVRELGVGGRNAQEIMRVNEAELLLGMSRERWLLSGDLSGTLHALELAATAVSGLKGPQWLNLRQTMSQELAAFRAIESDPRAIARGELDALEDLLPQLPKASGSAPPIVSNEQGIKRLLNALVQIQPTGQQNLISPSERQAAQTALLLEITNARMALQMRQDEEYKRSVKRIDQWLTRLYVQTPALKERRERLRATAAAPLGISVPLAGSSLLELQRLKQETSP
jgi:uroporphyrin-3 C-methyltransferase